MTFQVANILILFLYVILAILVVITFCFSDVVVLPALSNKLGECIGLTDSN